MVIDPVSMFEELAGLSDQGIHWKGRVKVSDRAHLVLPGYKSEDRSIDEHRPVPSEPPNGASASPTAKGLPGRNPHGRSLGSVIWGALSRSDRDWLEPYKEPLASMKVNLADFMMAAEGKKILLEGAQGSLLDIDHGTYPYVSSGISTSSGAAIGAALGPRRIHRCLGVFKAYQTRVGNGPFPSEMPKAKKKNSRSNSGNWAMSTEPPPDAPDGSAYLDLVALKYAGWVNSLDGLILSHLNLYDGFDSLGFCTAYELDGQTIHHFPSNVGGTGTA